MQNYDAVITKAHAEYVTRVESHAGLTKTQRRILTTLLWPPFACTLGEIACVANISLSHAHRVLKQLRGMGWTLPGECRANGPNTATYFSIHLNAIGCAATRNELAAFVFPSKERDSVTLAKVRQKTTKVARKPRRRKSREKKIVYVTETGAVTKIVPSNGKIAALVESYRNQLKNDVRIDSPDILPILEFARLSAERFAAYHNRSFEATYIQRLRPSDPEFMVYRKVFYAAKDSGLSLSDFLESQYYWFNRWFGRAPRLKEMGSAKALARAQQWQELRTQQPDLQTSGFVAPVDMGPLSIALVHDYEAAMFERMCKNHGLTPEQMFEAAGNPVLGIFDPEWLTTQPLWQTVAKRHGWNVTR